jgi:hypothetical protein
MDIRSVSFATALVLSIALGCGGDDGAEGGSSTGDSGGSVDGSTTGTGTSTSGTGGSSTDTSSAGTGGDSSDGSGAADSSSDAGSSGGSETGASGCARIDDQIECMMAGCFPVSGAEYLMMMDMWCIGPRTLIECQEVAGQMCMPTITVACDPDGGGAWSFPNTCLPDGWMECDAPAEGAPAC